MKKLIAVYTSIIAFILIVGSLAWIVIWMNQTPGHYRIAYCGCGVVYMADQEFEQNSTEEDIFEGKTQRLKRPCPQNYCPVTFYENIYLKLSQFDYNK